MKVGNVIFQDCNAIISLPLSRCVSPYNPWGVAVISHRQDVWLPTSGSSQQESDRQPDPFGNNLEFTGNRYGQVRMLPKCATVLTLLFSAVEQPPFMRLLRELEYNFSKLDHGPPETLMKASSTMPSRTPSAYLESRTP